MTEQRVIGHTNGTNGSSYSLDWTVFANTIDGKQVQTAKTRHSINPANGEPGPDVPVSTSEDVENAMVSAQKGFAAWSIVPWEERKEATLAFASGLKHEKDNFVNMLTREQGKPLFVAGMELDLAISFIETVASLVLPEERYQNGQTETVVRYTPLGVCVGIVPWNFPILLACGKLASAVMTGNSIILKPSPFTPAGDLKLVELAQRYFPPGVVQCLSGGDDLGPLLTAHAIPAKISFTGSTFTGKKVMESASKTLKRVTLELGGNDPTVILDDIDIDTVAPKDGPQFL
ncbi:hypothetical protein B0A52_08372 [Exophiala mesophila]|uniref:aldehyde dehydrogenase (NAD(+)) n=1 Tax=Exophiala mesophila TaxID=212818 RepID=A0A438MTY7_EXOME|nr:hypothetical protein B0A52_08372 [Exophiala mesophila]